MTYNLNDAIKRIDKYSNYINTYNNCKIREAILSNDKKYEVDRFYSTVIYLDIDCESDIFKSIYIDEVYMICRSNPNYRDIQYINNGMFIIYNSALKSDVNSIIDDIGRINTLHKVILKRIDLKCDINIKIIAWYGKLTARFSNTMNRYIWVGEVFDKVTQYINSCGNNEILINRILWNSLSDHNQKLFNFLSHVDKDELYKGKFENIIMRNWLTM